MQTQAPHQILPKPLPNGDIQTNGLKHIPKKILPPFHDTRSDLMKSIRDGKLKKDQLYVYESTSNNISVG